MELSCTTEFAVQNFLRLVTNVSRVVLLARNVFRKLIMLYYRMRCCRKNCIYQKDGKGLVLGYTHRKYI